MQTVTAIVVTRYVDIIQGRMHREVFIRNCKGYRLSNNLINLGMYEEVEKALAAHGRELTEIEEMEMEPSLGNGGHGRLAACFLDSIATLGLPGDGIGLNYHFGLFRQLLVDHKQKEVKNPWITNESWLVRQPVSFAVPYKNFTMHSTLYDIDVPRLIRLLDSSFPIRNYAEI